MPRYRMSWRNYSWPAYEAEGEGVLRKKEFDAQSDDEAIQEVRRCSDQFHGHEFHQAYEHDYSADFQLTRLGPGSIKEGIELPSPRIIPAPREEANYPW